MQVEFTKAVASGNDFVILNNFGNKYRDLKTRFADFARFVCRRRFSVGADGLLVLEASKTSDFKMRIFNPDGGEVSMCGNGIRASAVCAYENNLAAEKMKIETLAGVLAAEINSQSVKVKMTEPKDVKIDQNIGIESSIVNMHSVDTGVPHAIHFVDNIKDYPVKKIGELVRRHKVFEPEGTNADFVKVIDPSTIEVRTYERGVEDETLACGTGIVASAVIANIVHDVRQPVSVLTKSKETLKVYFRKERDVFKDVYFEGKAFIVFKGVLEYV